MSELHEYRELYATALDWIKCGAVATVAERKLARAMVEQHFRGRLDRRHVKAWRNAQ